MNDIATLENDAGFSVFSLGTVLSGSKRPIRWSVTLP